MNTDDKPFYLGNRICVPVVLGPCSLATPAPPDAPVPVAYEVPDEELAEGISSADSVLDNMTEEEMEHWHCIEQNVVNWDATDRLVPRFEATPEHYQAGFEIVRSFEGGEVLTGYIAAPLGPLMAPATVLVTLRGDTLTPYFDPETVAAHLESIATHIRDGLLMPDLVEALTDDKN